MKDFQTKQGRLQKKYPLSHFRPELINPEEPIIEQESKTSNTVWNIVTIIFLIAFVFFLAEVFKFIF